MRGGGYPDLGIQFIRPNTNKFFVLFCLHTSKNIYYTTNISSSWSCDDWTGVLRGPTYLCLQYQLILGVDHSSDCSLGWLRQLPPQQHFIQNKIGLVEIENKV